MSDMSRPVNVFPWAVALADSCAKSLASVLLASGCICFARHMTKPPKVSTMALMVAGSFAGVAGWLFSMGASFLVAVEGVRAVNGTGLGVPALFRHSHAGAHALAGQAQTGVSLPALARGLSGLAVAFFFLPIF
jgi:hypothetical protein